MGGAKKQSRHYLAPGQAVSSGQLTTSPGEMLPLVVEQMSDLERTFCGRGGKPGVRARISSGIGLAAQAPAGGISAAARGIKSARQRRCRAGGRVEGAVAAAAPAGAVIEPLSLSHPPLATAP